MKGRADVQCDPFATRKEQSWAYKGTEYQAIPPSRKAGTAV
jgi:hypothetical protein